MKNKSSKNLALILLISLICLTCFSGCDKTKNDSLVAESFVSLPVLTETRPEFSAQTYEFEDEFFAPTYDKLYFEDTKANRTVPYNLSLPTNYDENKKYPVLLLLHGMGSQGDDFFSAASNFSTIFRYSGDLLFNSIVVIPQTTEWWFASENGKDNGWLDSVMRLLYKIEKTYSCDLDRIYLSGLSMGGYGTWNLLEYYGDHFAAAVPICGGGNTLCAEKLVDIPIWIYHGVDDPTVPIAQSEMMYNAIKNAGGNKIHFTKLEGVKHDSWGKAYQSRELLSWMYCQNKSKNKSSKYELIPYFRLEDPNGKTVFTEFDTLDISFVETEGQEQIEFMLTDDGIKKLTETYQKFGNKKFSLYYGNYKLLSFNATSLPADNMFVLKGVFTAKNYWWYLNRTNLLMNR